MRSEGENPSVIFFFLKIFSKHFLKGNILYIICFQLEWPFIFVIFVSSNAFPDQYWIWRTSHLDLQYLPLLFRVSSYNIAITNRRLDPTVWKYAALGVKIASRDTKDVPVFLVCRYCECKSNHLFIFYFGMVSGNLAQEIWHFNNIKCFIE